MVPMCLVQVDIEGGELGVLAAFDFSAVAVDVVLVECTSARRPELRDLMHSKGFARHEQLAADDVFVRRRAQGLCTLA